MTDPAAAVPARRRRRPGAVHRGHPTRPGAARGPRPRRRRRPRRHRHGAERPRRPRAGRSPGAPMFTRLTPPAWPGPTASRSQSDAVIWCTGFRRLCDTSPPLHLRTRAATPARAGPPAPRRRRAAAAPARVRRLDRPRLRHPDRRRPHRPRHGGRRRRAARVVGRPTRSMRSGHDEGPGRVTGALATYGELSSRWSPRVDQMS